MCYLIRHHLDFKTVIALWNCSKLLRTYIEQSNEFFFYGVQQLRTFKADQLRRQQEWILLKTSPSADPDHFGICTVCDDVISMRRISKHQTTCAFKKHTQVPSDFCKDCGCPDPRFRRGIHALIGCPFEIVACKYAPECKFVSYRILRQTHYNRYCPEYGIDCKGTSKNGDRCKNTLKRKKGEYCFRHLKQSALNESK